MMQKLRVFTKTLPSLFTAFLLAVAVWVMAINSSDPSVEKVYPNPVPIEVIGQSPDTVINTDISENVEITLRAPNSIWNMLLVQKAPVRAFIDLAGLGIGPHTVPVQIQIGTKPVEIIAYTPRSITLDLEPLLTKTMDIRVIYQGILPIGYQADEPVLAPGSVSISGAASNVNSVVEVRAIVKLTDVKESIHQSIQLIAVNASGSAVNGVSITPEKVEYSQKIAERGGYRNVVVKVVTSGLVASGYKLTNLSVFPPTLTVYGTDPLLIDNLPGYVETLPIDLTGKTADFEQRIALALPYGVQAIESDLVTVNVGIAPIESSISLEDIIVEATGVSAGRTATITPATINVVISGPVIVLQALKASDLRVLVDVTGMGTGKFTIEPNVVLNIPGLVITSHTPMTLVIEIK
jgi:YbbR domain-containing protein